MKPAPTLQDELSLALRTFWITFQNVRDRRPKILFAFSHVACGYFAVFTKKGLNIVLYVQDGIY